MKTDRKGDRCCHLDVSFLNTRAFEVFDKSIELNKQDLLVGEQNLSK